MVENAVEYLLASTILALYFTARTAENQYELNNFYYISKYEFQKRYEQLHEERNNTMINHIPNYGIEKGNYILTNLAHHMSS